MAGTKLELGKRPDPLVVTFVRDDPATLQLQYLDVNETPAPWPIAPKLEFPALDSVNTATLSSSDSIATWEYTAEEVDGLLDTLEAAGSDAVRLSVDGVTWFTGVVISVA